MPDLRRKAINHKLNKLVMKDNSKFMQMLHFSIRIHASKEKVWHTMLDDETYRQWTTAFSEGSYYKGSWEKGSKILFLDSKGMGMVSKIEENKPYEFISIEHSGYVKDGKDDVKSKEAKAMAGAHENYTFKEKDGITELLIDVDIPEEYKDIIEDIWPKALSELKELAEKKSFK